MFPSPSSLVVSGRYRFAIQNLPGIKELETASRVAARSPAGETGLGTTG
jgi:hypothetical protein